MLRRLLSGLRWAFGLGAPESPWDRVSVSVPATAFGPGSLRDFAHYFEGESSVRVRSIDDIVEWLLTCEYTADSVLFNEPDFWQHPTSFEQLRRGDCEDFALWAWRKLAEIDIEAEFYVGRVLMDEPLITRQHAWVVYRAGGTDFLFEPAARRRERMIRRLTVARDEYVPHFSVTRDLRTSAFGGYLLDSSLDRKWRRDPTQAACL